MPDARQVFTRQIEVVTPQGAGGQHHGVMPGEEIGERDVFAYFHAASDFNTAAADLLDFAVDDVAR